MASKLTHAELELRVRELEKIVAESKKTEIVYEELESRVEARTAELKVANEEFQREIDRRKHVEEAWRQSEEEFRLLFETMASGFTLLEMIYDENGKPVDCRYVKVNPSHQRHSGLNPSEIIGKTAKEVFGLKDEWIEIYGRVDKTGEPVMIEDYAAGLGKWFLVIAYRPKPGFVAVTFDNITARKQAEEEKAKLEAQLRHAHKMEAIGTLTGGIAHEFNNILGIIIGHAELAMEDIPEWNPARLSLGEIKTAGLRATDVVRQLLGFSRKTEQRKKPVKIHTIIKESMNLLRASIPTTIDIRSNIPKDLGIIMADPTQIHQILINICTNATHAMEENGGILEVSLTEVELDEDTSAHYHEIKSGPYIQLTVSDTGHGIDPEIKDRIFDPYFTTKEIDKGTGLGLAVVHGIVKNHDGAISVYSEPALGTTVKVLFPRIDERPTRETVLSNELPTGNEKVLFIDDEKSLVKMGQRILKGIGYQVDTRTDPLEALDLFRLNPDQFDLIITDMTMPQMTGDRLAKKILDIRQDMPIIICTGFSEKINEEKANKIGIRKYIEKPLDTRKLALAVREVLDGKD